MAKTEQTEFAIQADDIIKNFVLPHERTASVKQAFTRALRRTQQTEEMQHALRGVSFDIKPGEFFGIVGRNGSGKSTLLKLLAGIYQPTKGSVHVQGKLVPFIELGVGFNPELTGRENIYLNGALLGFSKKEVQAMYHDIVEFAELERFMDQKLKNYSSGMQVRLAFSLAIRANADILLIDEVLAVGDADFQRKCFEYFKLLKKQKKTVVFVTHDMGAVREYCDRGILIDGGKVVSAGSASVIAEQYSRLFVEEETKADKKKSGDRWGDGAAKVSNVHLDKSVYTEKDDTLTLTTTFKVNENLDSPIIGFSIKDSADTVLFGTNTTIKHVKIGDVKKGEQHTVTWTMPNILADGRHYVNVTIERENGITVCDWWNEAIVFTSHKEEHTAYHITPPIEVTFSK